MTIEDYRELGYKIDEYIGDNENEIDSSIENWEEKAYDIQNISIVGSVIAIIGSIAICIIGIIFKKNKKKTNKNSKHTIVKSVKVNKIK